MSKDNKISISLLDTAKEYINMGLSVVVTQKDKRPIGSWKHRQTTRATLSEIEKDLTNPAAHGIGIVCGAVSGGLEILDGDMKFDITKTLSDDYFKRVESNAPGLINKVRRHDTVSGGWHLAYLCLKIEGNQKLASRAATAQEIEKGDIGNKPLFETRAEGGFIVAPPTEGYKVANDVPIPTITAKEREILLGTARHFDEVETFVTYQKQSNHSKLSPGDDYNDRGDAVSILEKHGWKNLGKTGHRVLMLRPGKSEGSSGDFHTEKRIFKVFSTSTDFEAGKGYGPFSVFAKLECKDDFSLAAKRLSEMGFGDKLSVTSKGELRTANPTVKEEKMYGEFSEYQVKEWRKQAKIDTSIPCPQPPCFLSVTDGIKDYPLLHLSAFSMVIGKAKSRKTFAVLLLLAEVISKKPVSKNIRFSPIPGKSAIVVFDNEMAGYRVHRSAHRIQDMAENYDQDSIEVYSLREFSVEQRIAIIEDTLRSRSDILMVVIDGIRDLLYDINDPRDSTIILTTILKWTSQYGVHIMGVLHENKGDTNARGHIGTEGTNKADLVISVTRVADSPAFSLVASKDSRDQDFPSFVIGISDNGLPYVVDDFAISGITPEGQRPAKKDTRPTAFPDSTHKMILEQTFKGRIMKRGDAISALRPVLNSFSIPDGKSKAEDFFSYYHLSKSWVVKKGRDHTAEVAYEFVGITNSNELPF